MIALRFEACGATKRRVCAGAIAGRFAAVHADRFHGRYQAGARGRERPSGSPSGRPPTETRGVVHAPVPLCGAVARVVTAGTERRPSAGQPRGGVDASGSNASSCRHQGARRIHPDHHDRRARTSIRRGANHPAASRPPSRRQPFRARRCRPGERDGHTDAVTQGTPPVRSDGSRPHSAGAILGTPAGHPPARASAGGGSKAWRRGPAVRSSVALLLRIRRGLSECSPPLEIPAQLLDRIGRERGGELVPARDGWKPEGAFAAAWAPRLCGVMISRSLDRPTAVAILIFDADIGELEVVVLVWELVLSRPGTNLVVGPIGPAVSAGPRCRSERHWGDAC